MAIYYGAGNEKACPIKGICEGDNKDQMNFFIDGVSDLANLPGIDKIRGGSSAMDLSAKQVYFLTKDGWV